MHAKTFRALHADGPILIIANAWDCASARLVEACGAAAIATSSAAVSWTYGRGDGEQLDLESVLATARAIVRAVRIPVSIDFEAGYAATPEGTEANVRRLADTGASGINLEDGSAPPEVLEAKIAAAKRAAPELFVNARTDVYLRGLVAPGARVKETLERARRYRDAGADGLFVPGLTAKDEIAAVARDAQLPLNLMMMPGLTSPAELQALGVRRLSAGTALAQAALSAVRRSCTALYERGEYGDLFEGAIPYAEMNALFRA